MSVELWYQGQVAHPQQGDLPAHVCCLPLSRLICAIKRVEILALFWFKPAFLMSDNQTSWQLTHDLLSDDGHKITFVLSTAAGRCMVAYCPLSNDIKLSERVKSYRSAAAKGNQVLGMIRRNITYKEKSLIVPLYKAIVRTHLEYCIQAWIPYLRKDIDMLEKYRGEQLNSFQN